MAAARTSVVIAVLMALPVLAVMAFVVFYNDTADPSKNFDKRVVDSAVGRKDKSERKNDLNSPATIVGVEVCSRCHRKQAEALATSGHSRTFAHSSRSAAARALDGQEFQDPERGYKYRYKFDSRTGLSVTIPSKSEKPFPLEYALGSGTHAVTFLTLIPNRKSDGKHETIGIEHRVSVFPKAKTRQLDLSPGHTGKKAEQAVADFGVVLTLPVLERCVGCHTTESAVSGLSLDPLRENVSCENCHGPGSRHVAAAERGDPHPQFLELSRGSHDSEAQVRLCGHCHRVAEMMEKHKPHRGDAQLVRFQPVGLMQSRCYRESKGEMSCSTCHDPHGGTLHDTAHYVAQCLKCHQPQGGHSSVCPVSAEADCLRCHMPAVKNVHEESFTDHWIRVRDKRDPQALLPIPPPKHERP